MPYENEHACRLEDPDKYDNFRRQNGDIEIDGKYADAIYGEIDGDWELQAVRFPVEDFTENEARQWCQNHDSIAFEPAVENSLQEDEANHEHISREDIEEIMGILGGHFREMFDSITDAYRTAEDDEEFAAMLDSILDSTTENIRDALEGNGNEEQQDAAELLAKQYEELSAQDIKDIIEKAIENEGKEEVSYTLSHHWWKTHSMKRSPIKEHWDLFIDDQQFVLDENPIENKEVTGGSRSPLPIKHLGTIGPNYIKPGDAGNPTDNTPCWIEQVASGTAKIIRDEGKIKEYTLQGDVNKRIHLKEQDDEWHLKDITNKEKQLNEHKLAAKTIKIDLMERNEMGDLEVSGVILGSGVWNNYYWPEEVIKNDISEEDIRAASIDVGKTHDDKHEDVGEVLEIEYDEEAEGWWIRTLITNEEAASLAETIYEEGSLGWSVEVTVYEDSLRNIIEEITELSAIVAVDGPASQVSYIDMDEDE